MSTVKKKSTVQIDNEPLAYLGPTIPGIATEGEVYTNGIPTALRNAAAEKPLLNKLIVKLTDMPAAQKEILKKNGSFYEAYVSATKG